MSRGGSLLTNLCNKLILLFSTFMKPIFGVTDHPKIAHHRTLGGLFFFFGFGGCDWRCGGAEKPNQKQCEEGELMNEATQF